MKFKEELLHWIWKTGRFDFHNVQTCDGEPVIIHNAGKLNNSDGPDFLGAEITIGNLRWFGDVEIHWKLDDWQAHGHNGDPNYEKVILHVLFEYNRETIIRSDGSSIPNLCLGNYLTKPLKSFTKQYQQNPQLPCSAQLSFISEEAFRKQLQKAHKEYFEQKVEDLLEFYNPSLTPSQAWLKMFIIALFDGLGISHNRDPMRKLAKQLFSRVNKSSSTESIHQQARKLAGIDTKDSESYNNRWNHKGIRPGNHPSVRIRQASDFLAFIIQQPFERWMKDDPVQIWKELTEYTNGPTSIGKERSTILFGTVFLPSLYSLGNLFYNERLRQRSWELWQNHQAEIPKSLLRLFEKTKLPSHIYAKKLGIIHQIRDYCKPKKCQSCKVFKNAISS